MTQKRYTEQNAVVYPNTSNVHPNAVGQKLMSIGFENGLKKSIVSEFFI